MTMGPNPGETLRKPMGRRGILGAALGGAAALAVPGLAGADGPDPSLAFRPSEPPVASQPAGEPAAPSIDGSTTPVDAPSATLRREVTIGDETFFGICEPIEVDGAKIDFLEAPGNEINVQMLQSEWLKELVKTSIPGRQLSVVFEAPFPAPKTPEEAVRNGLEYRNQSSGVFAEGKLSGQIFWRYVVDKRFETPLLRLAPTKSDNFDIKSFISNPELNEPTNFATSGVIAQQLLMAADYGPGFPDSVAGMNKNGPALVGLSVKT